MAARTKPKGGVAVATLEEADAALAGIAGIDRELETIDQEMNQAIDAAKAKAADAARPLRKRREELGMALKVFALSTKTANFTKRKSVELLHGVIGFRVSSKLGLLKGFTWKKVLETIQDLIIRLDDPVYDSCVRPKSEVDKEAVKQLSEEDMARIGCVVKSEDEFFVEIKKESAAERAA